MYIFEWHPRGGPSGARVRVTLGGRLLSRGRHCSVVQSLQRPPLGGSTGRLMTPPCRNAPCSTLLTDVSQLALFALFDAWRPRARRYAFCRRTFIPFRRAFVSGHFRTCGPSTPERKHVFALFLELVVVSGTPCCGCCSAHTRRRVLPLLFVSSVRPRKWF